MNITDQETVALLWKYPDYFPQVKKGELVSLPGEELTKAQIATALTEHTTYLNSIQYITDRKNEYPSGGEIAIAWAEKELDADPTAWDKIVSDRAAVKLKYPTPS